MIQILKLRRDFKRQGNICTGLRKAHWDKKIKKGKRLDRLSWVRLGYLSVSYVTVFALVGSEKTPNEKISLLWKEESTFVSSYRMKNRKCGICRCTVCEEHCIPPGGQSATRTSPSCCIWRESCRGSSRGPSCRSAS